MTRVTRNRAAATVGVVAVLAAAVWTGGRFIHRRTALATGYVEGDGDRFGGIAAEWYSGIRGRLYFRGRAEELTRGLRTDRERVDRLLDWTYLQVRPASVAAPSRVLFGDPFRAVKRGYGFCDESAHVFSTLARDAGLLARVFYLRRADGMSPHTVAQVLIDGTWVFVDTLFGRVLEVDGKPLTLEQLRADPTLLDVAYADLGVPLPFTVEDWLRGEAAFEGEVPWWRT